MAEITVKLTQNNQITIPSEILKKAGIEKGSILKFELKEDGIFVKLSDVEEPDEDGEKWFWTEEWQEKEREADEAIVKGEMVGPFDDIDEALQALKMVEL